LTQQGKFSSATQIRKTSRSPAHQKQRNAAPETICTWISPGCRVLTHSDDRPGTATSRLHPSVNRQANIMQHYCPVSPNPHCTLRTITGFDGRVLHFHNTLCHMQPVPLFPAEHVG
ncbi:hypothetical protein ANANG_G00083040, partial [Anguilla anguilla]